MTPVITIDGPSGSGKGTVGRLLAQRLGWRYLDSGAIYRALAVAARRAGLADQCEERLGALAESLQVRFDGDRVLLGDEDISAEIRDETTGNLASRIAAMGAVRAVLLHWQRAYAQPPGLVGDGRDLGTVVFPNAQLKVFLTASVEERARRRYNQLKEKGLDVNFSGLAAEIQERDARDRNRGLAPLTVAASALEIESTALSIDQVLEQVLLRAREILPGLECQGDAK